MSELRSAIDPLRSQVLAELPDALAEEAFAEVRRGIEALRAEGLRRSVPGLARVLGHWAEAAATHAGADTEDARSARRHLHASATLDGAVRVDGELDSESGEALLTALQAVCDARLAREMKTSALPPSVGPMPWGRCVASGWISPPSRGGRRATASHPHRRSRGAGRRRRTRARGTRP